jgi:hypothetical protein
MSTGGGATPKPLSTAQFGLSASLAAVTGLAILFAICVRIPRPALVHALQTAPTLLACSALFAFLPLTCINLVCVAVLRLLRHHRDGDPHGLRVMAPHRLLWQAAGSTAPSLGIAVLIAVSCTVVLSLLWPFMREFGLGLALVMSGGVSRGQPILAEIPKLMGDARFVGRLFRWEFFSLLRWWILFGSLATLWVAVTWPIRKRYNFDSPSQCYSRLLAFAPWLVVIETAFLVGVWTHSPITVPEPSTGFVEGVFSWNLWHWDCWQGVVWISRGFIPTFVVTALFFRNVLRWPWLFAAAPAACAIPVALMLSVAWSVLYGQLL